MKLRTHKTTAKRYRKTGSGKVVHSTTSAQHLRSNKTGRQLAHAKTYTVASKGIAKRVRKLTPYM